MRLIYVVAQIWSDNSNIDVVYSMLKTLSNRQSYLKVGDALLVKIGKDENKKRQLDVRRNVLKRIFVSRILNIYVSNLVSDCTSMICIFSPVYMSPNELVIICSVNSI